MSENAVELNETKDPNKFQVRADLHVHTIFSDSVITLKDLVFYAKKSGLNAVAITDHNCVEGAAKFAKETGELLIIPGIEVSSMHGHIVGLNVHQVIPKGLTADETVDKIHQAGGIAVACHPYAMFKGSIGKHVTAKFDAIEVINACATPFSRCVSKAQQTADTLKLPGVAGTDAHYGPQIGHAYTIIEAELNIESIMIAIKAGRCQPYGKPVPTIMKLKKQCAFYKKKISSK
jgi:predicted metal-dependent phosphoesterase TrpH